MSEIISKIIPIFLLIALGYIIKQKNLVKQETMNELKDGVINIALPALLFITFRDMTLKKEYFLVMIATFILLIVLYRAGILINKIKAISHPLVPFVTTSFTFGLLGIPLFASVFGMENLEKISIFGVAHEFFVWFVFYTLLKMKFSNERFSRDTIKGFISSPLVISIILGLLLNILGLDKIFFENTLFMGIDITLNYLSNIATPIILIIIGFGLKLNKIYLKQSMKLFAIRITTILIIGYIFKIFIINKIITNDPLLDYAYFTFLILPPPLSLSLFVDKYAGREYSEIANNIVVIHTIVCVIMFVIFAINI
ncbi:MAG: AEC family transporter [Senegalia sp. (in: firmicutes)]|uniref:AEC family transporter n=1 Tax=Senegalia sp. (in: firmicutes) TaxID=1924098 RepID=UPI003F9EA02E